MTNLGATVAERPVHLGPAASRSRSTRSASRSPRRTLTFIKNNTDAELLAKPQLRISEGQKAQLLIGDKVPDPRHDASTASDVSGQRTSSPVTSYQYQDIGIKIEVEPRVHHNKEVTLKLMVEVSNSERQRSRQGDAAAVIGTRTISSNIRLKDGETNFLAGLYRHGQGRTPRTRSRSSATSRSSALLFTHNTNDHQTTDLVLTLTPHIIRIPDVTEEDVTPVLRRHRREHLVPGRSPRREPDARQRSVRAAAGGRARCRAPNQGRTPPQSAPQPPAAHPGHSAARRRPTSSSRRQPAPPPPASAAGAGPAAVFVLVLALRERRRVGRQVRGRRRGDGPGVLSISIRRTSRSASGAQQTHPRPRDVGRGPAGRHRRDPVRSGGRRGRRRPTRSSAATAGSPTPSSQKDHIVIQFPSAEELGGHAGPRGDHAAGGRAGPLDARLRAARMSRARRVVSTPSVVDVR